MVFFFFFFFFSLTSSGTALIGDFLHFRPNPTEKHWKTQTQPQKSIIMPQNIFVNSNIKPESGRLTIRGFNYSNAGECRGQRGWLWITAKPTASTEWPMGLFLCLSLSLSPHCVHPFFLASLSFFSLLRSFGFPRLNEKKYSDLVLYKFFVIFLFDVRCLIFVGWQKILLLHHDRTKLFPYTNG